MSLVTRLRLLAAVLGVSAASVAVGTFLFGDGQKTAPKVATTRPAGATVMEELARTRFTNQPTLTYTTKDGETLFAWQVKPAVTAGADRPRDILVMVDTSASQAGKPITYARQIINGLTKTANPGDRVSVWTVNLNTDRDTRTLTGGFQPANGEAVQNAVARLADTEYGAGATDLVAGIERAGKTFENRDGRQQILLLLGDGESTASPTPVSEAARVALGRDLDRNGIQFFAVPLGMKIQANTIHGLAALTGGAVVRMNDDLAAQHGQSIFAEKLKASFSVPVLRTEKAAFGPEVAEVFPTSLPPLRADRATLVVGKLSGPARAVTLTVNGSVAGKRTDLALSENLAAAQTEHYFLHPMIEQWRTAGAKDAPAILAADRTLALAAEQFRLFKDEYLVQAEWAVSTGRLDQAEKLFRAAATVDPADRDATSGLKVVEKMRAGKVTLDQIRKGLAAETNGTKLAADGSATKVVLRTLAEQDAKPAAGGGAQPPAGGSASPVQNDLLRDAQARRAIQEDQFRVLVDDTVRKARQLQLTDPDAAYEALKMQREAVLGNDQIGDRVRSQLTLQLDAQMRDVQTRGAELKRRVAEERERIARARALISDHERMMDQEIRTQARIEQFKELMKKARFELAQQEAEIMRQERIAQGQSIPPAVLASYTIGQRATNLREHRELIRIRDDRFLLTLMQVEKSFIPYPDEPPVHFPPATIWRELTANRILKYGRQSLGEEIPQSLRDLQNTIENKRVKFEEVPANVPLREILENLSKQFDVNFILMEEAFKAEGMEGLLEKKPNVNQKLNGLTLRSFLDIILAGVNATYVVRPEYIEITTVNRRLEEKVTQVFPVADLVIPIPQSVNQQQLFQNLQLQGAQLAIFGQALGAANFLGGLGGGFQGGFGGGIGGGGLGAVGGGQIGLQGGLGAGGGQLGQLGALGQQGQGFGGNQGVGGGILGTTGGQLGQFGNLGGQFGLQGGDQSGLLLQIIIETVARGEWTTPNAQQLQQQPGQNADEETLEILPKKQLNSLGYYPPARALIVRGTGLYHTNSSYKLKLGEAQAAGGPGLPRKGVFAIGPKAPGGNAAPANAKADQPRVVNPKEDPVVLAKQVERVPDRMWQQALDLSNVTDPGLIVACAEFMMDSNASVHAAELLKANLRKGVANETWAHDALAVTLKVAKGDANEIMRAGMSGIDLEPADPKAYLLAANAAGDNNRYDLALAYLKRAANLEPNTPAAYLNALSLATRTNDVTSDVIEWAATGLYARDWTNDGLDVRAEATAKLSALAKKYDNTPRKAEIDRLVELATKPKRDLVVELRYQGAAVDLDLAVAEPTGGVATATNKRTSGGGVLVSDVLEQNDDRSEVYTAAQGFSGTYRASVKSVIGRAIGNKATLVVTKFAGTDRQVIETHSIDLANPKPVDITLDGGSRTELASVPTDDAAFRTLSTVAPRSAAPTGLSGGVGSATSSVLNADAGSRAATALPTVVKPMETNVPGIAPNAPGLRVEQTLTPDRSAAKISVNPVFPTSSATTLPKVNMLPGGGN